MTTLDRPSATASVVWGVWLALTVAGLAFVAEYGRNCPFMDEWEFVHALDPHTPLLEWSFQPHGEHRYPVPRVVYAGLFRLTGDLRAAMVLNVLQLAGAAALLVVAAGRARGRTAWPDLFFPLALLHAGHWENVLMAYQVNFTGGVLLVAVLLAAAAVHPQRWGWTTVAAASFAVVLLPGYGVFGLVYAAAAGVWLAGAAWVVARRSPLLAAVLLAAVLAAGGEAALYVATRTPSPFASLPRRWPELAGVAARLPAAAFGSGTAPLWVVPALLVGLGAAAAGRAVVRAGRGGDWIGPAGLVALAGGGGVLLAGIVWGRGWAGPEVAFMPRYAALALPPVAAAILAAIRFGSPRVAAVVPAAAAAVALAAWPANLDHGLFHARRTSRHTDDLRREYDAGWPADLILVRHDWQVIQVAPLTRSQFAGVSAVPGLGFEPRGVERRVRVEPVSDPRLTAVGGARSEEGRFVGSGGDDGIRVELPGRRGLLAVRIAGRFDPPAHRMARFRVRWRPAGSDRWEEERFQVGRGVEMPVYAGAAGPVGSVDVVPDDTAWGYRVIAVELLVEDLPP